MGLVIDAAAGSRGVGAVVIVVAALLLVLSEGARAAALGGELSGVVKDALDRPLAGAAVRIERDDGSVLARAITDAQARFAFSDVASGTYAARARRRPPSGRIR